MMQTPSELLQAFELKSIEPPLEEESQPFVLRGKPIQATVRQNSLYEVMKDLSSEGLAGNGEIKTESAESPILSGYRVECATNGAWLIHFDTAPENHLFLKEGFRYKRRHVRIDPCCANDSTLKAIAGFTAAHYTEQYEHSITGELRVAHAYIGQHASFTTWQVKSDDKLIMKGSTFSGFLEKNLEKNATSALELIEKLLIEKCNRYKQAIKKSYEIEAELDRLSEKILTNHAENNNLVELRTQYEKLVLCFSAEIEKINRYNDQETDQRAERAEELNEYIKIRSIINESPVLGIDDQTQNESSCLADSEINLIDRTLESLPPKSKKEIELQNAKSSLMQEIDLLKAKLKKNKMQDIPQLIDAQKLKRELRLKLFELSFFPNITQADKEFIKTATSEMNKTVGLFDRFKKAVACGEIESVRQLYPYVQRADLESIFYDLIFEQVIVARGKLLERLIKIANFFYENSNYYRALIPYLDRILVRISDNDRYPLLFKAFISRNHSAFELMLSHGFRANRIGYICEETSGSLINVITGDLIKPKNLEEDLKFLETLLRFGASVYLQTSQLNVNGKYKQLLVEEMKTLPVVFSNTKLVTVHGKVKASIVTQSREVLPVACSNKRSLVPKKNLKKDEMAFNRAMVKQMLGYKSALDLCLLSSNANRVGLLSVLAPKSDLPDLISALSSLGKNIKVVFALAGCIVRCSNEVLANKRYYKLQKFSETSASERNFTSAILVYPVGEEASGSWHESVSILMSNLNGQYREVAREFPEQIIKLRDDLIRKGEESSDFSEKCHAYKSALYLQVLNEVPSLEEAIKIVETLYNLSDAYLQYNTMCAAARVVPSEKVFAGDYLIHAYLYCLKSEYREELQEMPLFLILQEKFLLLKKAGLFERMARIQEEFLAQHSLDAGEPNRLMAPAAEIASRRQSLGGIVDNRNPMSLKKTM